MIYDWPERYGLDGCWIRHLDGDIGHGQAHRAESVAILREWISLEYRVTVPIPEWDDQAVDIMREEDTFVGGDGSVEYLSGPQTELWVIR